MTRLVCKYCGAAKWRVTFDSVSIWFTCAHCRNQFPVLALESEITFLTFATAIEARKEDINGPSPQEKVV